VRRNVDSCVEGEEMWEVMLGAVGGGGIPLDKCSAVVGYWLGPR
jgi:hypothetical protein